MDKERQLYIDPFFIDMVFNEEINVTANTGVFYLDNIFQVNNKYI